MPRAKSTAAEISNSIQSRIRETITRRNLSAHAVAVAADLNPSVVSRFVHDHRPIAGPTIDRLASVLGLELKETRRGLGLGGGRK